MELQDIVSFVDNWRAGQLIVGNGSLDTAQTTRFARDLQAEVAKFSVRAERASWGAYETLTPQTWAENARPVAYSGDIGSLPAWSYAKALSQAGSGEVFYISDTPAGQLLNAKDFKDAVIGALGGDDTDAGRKAQARLFSGEWADVNGKSTRVSNFGAGDVLALDDFVSNRMMAQTAYGDVRVLTAMAGTDRVFVQTELPALLNNPRVTAINGMDVAVLKEIYAQTGSYLEVNKAVAVASYDLMSTMRASFDGGILKVDSTGFFKDSGYPGTSLPPDTPNTRSIETDLASQRTPETDANYSKGIENFSEARLALMNGAISTVSKILNAGGIVATLYQIYQIEGDAQAALDAGDSRRAARTVINGFAEIGAGYAAGLTLGEMTAGFLATLLPLTPLGLAIGAIAAIGVGIAAGVGATEATKYLLDHISTGPTFTQVVQDGWKITSFQSGFIYSESIAASSTGINKQWLIPNDSSSTLLIQQNSGTGQDIRTEWSGQPETSTLISRTVTTPESADVVKVETITPGAFGSTTSVLQRKDTDDGTVLDTTTIVTKGDGSATIATDDGEHNTSFTRLDVDGNKLVEQWQKADGSHGQNTYDPLNGSRGVEITHADGTASKSTADTLGNANVLEYDRLGYMYKESWQHADGTHGYDQTERETGLKTGVAFAADGTSVRYVDDGAGNRQTASFDKSQVQTGAVSTGADGSIITDIIHADGSRERHAEDGKGYVETAQLNPDGTVLSKQWLSGDGSHGSVATNSDGSVTTTEVHPGANTVVSVKDVDGNVLSSVYSVAGTLVTESRTGADGSSSVTSHNFDGSTVGVYHGADGDTSRFSDDGKGNVILKTFDSAGVQTGVSWKLADGTSGHETTAHGVTSGTTLNKNGSYDRYDRKADGSSFSATYDQHGLFVSSVQVNSDGSVVRSYTDKDGTPIVEAHSATGQVDITAFLANGSVHSEHYVGGVKTGVTLDDSGGVRIDTVYGPDGVGVVSNTTTIYNPDGSGTVTIVDAQGRATEQHFGPGTLGPLSQQAHPDDPAPAPEATEPRWDGSAGPASNGSGDVHDNAPGLDPRDWIPNVSTPDGAQPSQSLDSQGVIDLKKELDAISEGQGSEFSADAIARILDNRNLAEGLFRRADPLVLDLDGDGLETVPLSAGVHFDHDANGLREATGWVAPDDGLLAWDRNGNGVIDNGTELFGNYTEGADGKLAANGFESLKTADSNGDGKIDAADASFAALRIWQDRNGDGKTDAGELLGLTAAGVASISTGYEVSTKVDSSNNQHLQIGQFTRADGSWGQVHDVWFDRDESKVVGYRPPGQTTHSAAIDALPEMKGTGAMTNLRDAMALDPTLVAAVQDFMAADSGASRRQLVDTIVQKWTGADKADFDTEHTSYNKHRLFAINVASGTLPYTLVHTGLQKNPGPEATPYIDAAYGALIESVYEALSKQAAASTMNSLLVRFDQHGAPVWSLPAYQLQKNSDPKGAIFNLVQMYTYYGRQLQNAGLDLSALVLSEADAYASDPVMRQFLADLNVYTGSGTLGLRDSYSGPTVLIGHGGDDVLYGSYSADLMVGGGGDDTLWVGRGDRVEFGFGDGHDRLEVQGRSMEIVLGKGVKPEDVTFALQQNPNFTDQYTLVLTLSSGDTLTVPTWYTASPYADAKDLYVVSQITFDNGQVWSAQDIYQHLPALTDGADSRVGSRIDDIVDGGGGNDRLDGDYGNDVLIGGTGDDYLMGGYGNDILVGGAGDDSLNETYGAGLLDGGAGNDTLDGGEGNDTYYFARGDGQDVIIDFTGLATRESDVLILGPGIRADDVRVTTVGVVDVLLSIRGSTDQVRIQGGFDNVNTILFDDGSTWSSADLLARQLHDAVSEGDDSVVGSAQDDTIFGLAGNDTIDGKGGNNQLDGGAGDDWLTGGAGTDRLSGGSGNDTLEGYAGDDTLAGGAGDDTLSGNSGNDTFVFGRGDGHDVIFDLSGQAAGEIDTIELGFNPGQLRFSHADTAGEHEKADLLISAIDSDDTLTVNRWFDQQHLGQLKLKFADGTIWGEQELYDAAPSLASNGDDYLYGGVGDVTLAGGAGNDVLNDAGGNSRLDGGDGNDTLLGGGGDDVLDGGAGNDQLDGGAGQDTYLFGYGSGHDTIAEYDRSDTADLSVDTIRLADGIRPQDVSISGDGMRILHLAGSDDQLTLASASTENRVERVVFSDGTVWNLGSNPNGAITHFTAIEGGYDWSHQYAALNSVNMVFKGTGQDDLIQIASYDIPADTIWQPYGYNQEFGTGANAQLPLHVTMVGGDGNDTLIGSTGQETLDGGAGADVLDGGANDDVIAAGANDTVVFGYGSGHDKVVRGYDDISTLAFSAGVDPADVQLAGGPFGQLIVRLRGSSDQVDIGYWFNTVDSSKTVSTFTFADGTRWGLDQIRERLSAADHGGDDYLYGAEGDDVLLGLQGNDTLIGRRGNDSLSGGAGDDQLEGDDGDDVLEGGAGNDTLDGGAGNDTFRFERGFGRDTVVDQGDWDTKGERSRIVLGSGIDAKDIIVTGDNSFTEGSTGNLYLSVFGTTDRITLKGWFSQGDLLGTVEFADGTVWNRTELLARYFSLERGGRMQGSDGADLLNGDGTADLIEGMAGNDTLNGGGGDDELMGDTGDDVLNGGAGDDRLFGGIGDDRYLFERGFGHDTIADFDRVTGSHDRIEFGAGIRAQDVTVSKNASDIVLTFGGSDDRLTVRWYDNPGLRIEELRFADGTVWTADQLQGLADNSNTLAGTADADVLTGDANANRLLGLAGNDRLIGLAGADVLDGGDGDDVLDGGAGADVLLGGAGNDTLDGGAGGDRMDGGAGDDLYLVDSAEDSVGEADGGGVDTVQASVDYSLADGIENLRLSGAARTGAGNSLDNVIDAAATASVLHGGAGADRLNGGQGGDQLFGDDGADLLAGGAGDDTLDGGAGRDTYLVERDGGNDVIVRDSGDSDGVDTLRFGAGIASGEIVVSADADYGDIESENNIYLSLGGGAGRVTLQHWLTNGAGSRVERVEFADGTVWDAAQLLAKAFAAAGGTDGDDTLRGSDGADTLRGLAGGDTLFGLGGDDVLVGGSGDDTLDGGSGDDVYQFARGDGADIIVDHDDNGANIDTVALGEGIASTDVTAVRDGDDLRLRIDDSDSLLLSNWFRSDADRIERVTFASGEVWDAAALLAKAQASGTDAGVLYGTDGADILVGGRGDDLLYGKAGADVYRFALGDGADTIYDAAGVAGEFDRVEFDAGIVPDDVSVSLQGANMVLNIGASGDSITMNNWTDVAQRIEQVVFANGTIWTGDDLVAKLAPATDGDDQLLAKPSGGTLNGLAGNDVLIGLEGDDTLNGGAGYDRLDGGAGRDVYLFAVGDGQDTIAQNDHDGPGDAVRFDASVTPADVHVSRGIDDLILSVGDGSDNITLSGWFDVLTPQVDRVEFANGTIWTSSQLWSMIPGATGGDDFLGGGAGDDTIDGGAGTDLIYGLAGNDTLHGGADYDIIDAGTGNDVLYGDAGDDYLQGGAGSDTYIFNPGDGRDDVFDLRSDGTDEIDTIRIKGRAPADFIVSRDDTSLYLLSNGIDRIALDSWYADDRYKAKQVVFDDGTVWTRETLLSHMDAGRVSEFDDVAYATEGNDVLAGLGGNDILSGADGNDLLDGGDGSDSLFGGGGNDVSLGGDGDDYMSDSSGNNLFSGDAGDDTMYGGEGNEVFVGGAGNDFISLGASAEIVLFNRGDGHDIVQTQPGAPGTISLGGAISYGDLSFKRNGDDLELLTGQSDVIDIRGWYGEYNGTTWKGIDTLQIVVDSGADYDAGSADTLKSHKIASFDFKGLVAEFDAALRAQPTLDSWSLSSSLLAFHINSSDSAALGGVLAYQYANAGTLSGVSLSAKQSILANSQLGSVRQSIT
ncbi:calcium-binding protein [Duganella sp. S19_KUP01_CR8]|uniref:calcium-binding protein n=1 Tax=Duganella sp. S19_KUP01_CR8 TaxID=3025502 RepID=UPI002FCDDFF8